MYMLFSRFTVELLIKYDIPHLFPDSIQKKMVLHQEVLLLVLLQKIQRLL